MLRSINRAVPFVKAVIESSSSVAVRTYKETRFLQQTVHKICSRIQKRTRFKEEPSCKNMGCHCRCGLVCIYTPWETHFGFFESGEGGGVDNSSFSFLLPKKETFFEIIWNSLFNTPAKNYLTALCTSDDGKPNITKRLTTWTLPMACLLQWHLCLETCSYWAKTEGLV